MVVYPVNLGNVERDLRAFGGNTKLSYNFKDKLKNQASLVFEYLSGDDPDTETYERYDTLTGGVQRDWAQGMDMIKIAINRNLRTHRLEVSVKPASGLDLSIDYYYFMADTLNNLGGQRAVSTYGDEHLGQEITPTLQWMVGESLFVQSFASFLIPGNGLRDVLPEPTRPWKTLQLSFYWFI